MALALSKTKLDVEEKQRSNLFNWRGQFTPDFVEYLLHHFAVSSGIVVDPFVGSGTVLHGALNAGIHAVGLEINPSAYAMSKIYTLAELSTSERLDLVNRTQAAIRPFLNREGGKRVYVSHPEYRVAYASLLKLGTECFPLLDKRLRLILLNCLFLSERDKKHNLGDSIIKSLRALERILLQLPKATNPIEVFLKDARQIGVEYRENIDLIFSSPPYINVFNYHQNHRALLELLNFNLLTVAESEFGSNRKNRGNRFRTVIQYSLDMEETLLSCWTALKTGGYLILVLGKQSKVRGIPFMNGKLVAEILDASGGFDHVDILERQFVNKFGMIIKEDILIYCKTNSQPIGGNARSIAVGHLGSTETAAPADVLNDLKDAIANADRISSSPIFNLRDVFKDA